MKSVKEIEKGAFDGMKKEFGYVNSMQAPRLVKAVVSVGVGSFKDKKKIDVVVDRLKKITGQTPVKKGAKKSIATFKTRTGDVVGCQVTLRGLRMFGFIDKILNIALPRTKDFRGLSTEAIDKMGNVTLGIREHTIFPETPDEEIKDVFGMAVTIVTTAKTAKESEAFLRFLGFPFKRINKGK